MAGPAPAPRVPDDPHLPDDDSGPDVAIPLDAPTRKRRWGRRADKPRRPSRAERKRAEKEAEEAVTLTDGAWWQGDDMDLSAMVTVPAADQETVQGPPAAEPAPAAPHVVIAPPTPQPASPTPHDAVAPPTPAAVPPEKPVPPPEPRPTLTLPPGAWSALLGSASEPPGGARAPTLSPTPPPSARTGQGDPSGSAEDPGPAPEPPLPDPPAHSVLSALLALQEVERERAPSQDGADRP